MTRLLIALVAAGTFIGSILASMVTVALPSISRDFAVPMDAAGWVVQGFLLVTVLTLLPAGRLGDRLGHLRVYRVGLAVLGAASVVCALAPSFWVLILGRGLQGFGAAMLMSCGPALLTTSVPRSQRGRVLGLVSTATYVGLTLGPPVGGFLVEYMGWHGIFIVSGVLAVVVLIPMAFQRREEGGGEVRWDLSTELRMFRSRVFTGTMGAAMLLYAGLFSTMVLMPFYLEEGLRLSPDGVGGVLIAQPLIMALLASPAGWLSDRIGTRGLTAAGLLVCTLALSAMALHLDLSSSVPGIMALLALYGLGCGLFVSPNTSALMGAADPKTQGSAGAMLAMARTGGMFIGVGLGTGVYSAAGGVDHGRWSAPDLHAFSVAMGVAAALMLAAAVVSVFRGEPER